MKGVLLVCMVACWVQWMAVNLATYPYLTYTAPPSKGAIGVGVVAAKDIEVRQTSADAHIAPTLIAPGCPLWVLFTAVTPRLVACPPPLAIT